MKSLLFLGVTNISKPQATRRRPVHRRPRGARQRRPRSVQPLLLEHQRIAFQLRHHAIAGHEVSAQYLLRERILDLRLDGALQGSCAVYGVESRLSDLVARTIIEEQLNISLREPLAQ